jgi:hypothetical protein
MSLSFPVFARIILFFPLPWNSNETIPKRVAFSKVFLPSFQFVFVSFLIPLFFKFYSLFVSCFLSSFEVVGHDPGPQKFLAKMK